MHDAGEGLLYLALSQVFFSDRQQLGNPVRDAFCNTCNTLDLACFMFRLHVHRAWHACIDAHAAVGSSSGPCYARLKEH